jgi:predicted RNA-binding protein with PIN domain
MSCIYLIDAYNVIHQCAQLKTLVHRDFEGARDALVERVSRYCGTTGEPAKVIFDGRGRKPELHTPYRGAPGLEVIYSPGHLTADAIIEREVYAAKDRREIVVVTGDRGIRDLCRGLGSLVMAPEHFLSMVDEVLTRSSAHLRTTYERFSTNLLEDRLTDHAREKLGKLKKRLKEK